MGTEMLRCAQHDSEDSGQGSPSPLIGQSYLQMSTSNWTFWLFFDGRADQAAPLGPGTIVVAYPGVAQQVVQHEPGMAAAFSKVFMILHACMNYATSRTRHSRSTSRPLPSENSD